MNTVENLQLMTEGELLRWKQTCSSLSKLEDTEKWELVSLQDGLGKEASRNQKSQESQAILSNILSHLLYESGCFSGKQLGATGKTLHPTKSTHLSAADVEATIASASLPHSNSHMISPTWQNAALKLPDPATDKKAKRINGVMLLIEK